MDKIYEKCIECSQNLRFVDIQKIRCFIRWIFLAIFIQVFYTIHNKQIKKRLFNTKAKRLAHAKLP